MELENGINPQIELVDSTEGIHLVDAGAGTGKTWAIIERYKKIIEKKTDPKDILLVTFTVNAANQMKEEVLRKLSDKVNVTQLLEAPIMNFHSYCSRLLKKFGTDAPSYLGINDILSNFRIIEESHFEDEMFRDFYSGFTKKHSEKYHKIFLTLDNDSKSVLLIIKKLCSVGIFPHSDGWLEEDKKKLSGNFELYSELFDEVNQPVIDKNGKKEIQNKLFKKFVPTSKRRIYPDFRDDIILSLTILPEIKEDSFKDATQEALIEFTRDVYFEYIEYLLKRNSINYEFMIMFAYLILYYNKKIRESQQFDYVMIDEFQDTDEIQFKIIMLLCKDIKGAANLCVVGDWKQGIYSFRNTDIENITKFTDNLAAYKEELNLDEERITYDTGEAKKIVFERNYRSSKRILEFSRRTLFIQGSKEEVMDVSEIEQNFKESLKPVRDLDDITEIEFYLAANRRQEILLILKKISQLVNEKEKYIIRDFDKATGEPAVERPVKYSDICVLTRNKVFGLELQRTALKLGIPVDYRGGIELFSSEPGILVLAWLRILLNDKNIFGWVPVLDKEGYSFNEQKYLLNKLTGKYYDQQHLFNTVETGLDEFLNRLRLIRENILYVVESVLRKYHYNDEVGNKIISVIKVWMGSDIISIADLVSIIDRSKKNEYDFEINNNSGSALVQTIHASKGLEYPVVIVANCNTQIFPDTKGDMSKFFYNPVLGLRMKKIFGSNGKYDYLFDNWRTDLTQSVIKKPDYDEERRLLYVGVTRSKQYLYFTSHNSSTFFTNLSRETNFVPVEDFDYEIKSVKTESENQKVEIKADKLSQAGRKFISPHSLMDEFIPDESNKAGSKSFSVKAGKDALEFGNSIHKAAHRIASGVDTPAKSIELKRVKGFIEDLKARELKSEVDFIFPRGNEIIRGTIDLLAFYDDRIEVIDYKTDKNKNNLEKYRIQMTVYKDVVRSIFPDKIITGKIFFVCIDEVVEI